ncbi:hypothetical protein AGLY_005154 [Aphis glycines]|uniref:Uncharacterized protein n=1 Tax=Aphis glycines TaxID=307491 RepID=A0A6G0TVZ4_APHGL|nr:hypothetical protein AGLY_005154 [Aphis glycines]
MTFGELNCKISNQCMHIILTTDLKIKWGSSTQSTNGSLIATLRMALILNPYTFSHQLILSSLYLIPSAYSTILEHSTPITLAAPALAANIDKIPSIEVISLTFTDLFFNPFGTANADDVSATSSSSTTLLSIITSIGSILWKWKTFNIIEVGNDYITALFFWFLSNLKIIVRDVTTIIFSDILILFFSYTLLSTRQYNFKIRQWQTAVVVIKKGCNPLSCLQCYVFVNAKLLNNNYSSHFLVAIWSCTLICSTVYVNICCFFVRLLLL